MIKLLYCVALFVGTTVFCQDSDNFFYASFQKVEGMDFRTIQMTPSTNKCYSDHNNDADDVFRSPMNLMITSMQYGTSLFSTDCVTNCPQGNKYNYDKSLFAQYINKDYSDQTFLYMDKEFVSVTLEGNLVRDFLHIDSFNGYNATATHMVFNSVTSSSEIIPDHVDGFLGFGPQGSFDGVQVGTLD